nr:MAG TPA: hypothetical protein [Caudoviricetes sp.]
MCPYYHLKGIISFLIYITQYAIRIKYYVILCKFCLLKCIT